MAAIEWFYAKDNKRCGPVSAAELKQLAASGALRPDDLVWCEKLADWTSARKVGGLFEDEASSPAKGAAPPRPPERPKAVAPAKSAEPLRSGEPPTTARPPAAEPSPKGAEPPEMLAPPKSAAPAFEKSEAAFERSRQRHGRHLFDVLLEAARSQLTVQFVELTTRLFTLGGHYGLYLAAAGVLALGVLLGVRLGQINTVLVGAAGAAILLLLQYTAVRYLGALERLNRSTPGRMCSSAFLDCCALLHMFGGLMLLLGPAVLAVQTGPLWLVLPGIGAFIVCQYVAVLALNPDSLNLTIASEATAGEEAIGVLSFLVKLGLRIVPVAFGAGVAGGTILLVCAGLLLFVPPQGPPMWAEPARPQVPDAAQTAGWSPPSVEQGLPDPNAARLLPARLTAVIAAAILIGSAALPFVAYVLFLVAYLGIDLLRAIFALGEKSREWRVESRE